MTDPHALWAKAIAYLKTSKGQNDDATYAKPAPVKQSAVCQADRGL